MKKTSGMSVLRKSKKILAVLFLISLAACGSQPTCLATAPDLKAVEMDQGILIPNETIGDLMLYIEQLENCANI